MQLLSIIFFSLAVSADGFIAGLAYGINKIRITLIPLLMIAAASALAVCLSMLLGRGIAAVLPEGSAGKAGSLLLFVMGVIFLFKALRDLLHNLPAEEDHPLMTLNLRPLGIVINILKDSAAADMDASGEISRKEAFFLGLALAVDAMGAGVGIAMAGYNILFTALTVGVLKFILVSSGIELGKYIHNEAIRSVASFIPGFIFITIGVLEFI